MADGVMQVIDSLLAGGAEHVAVMLANHITEEGFRSHLCVTRKSGPLANRIDDRVGMLSLMRRGSLDWRAIGRARRYISANNIRLLHAHGTSLFFARMAALGLPDVRVIWHNHNGEYVGDKRHWRKYRILTRGIAGIIAVNQRLVEWSLRLGVPGERVWYVPNMVEANHPGAPASLPFRPGRRIVSVANFRQEKDHETLLRAMAMVVREIPEAQLLMIGNINDYRYSLQIVNLISELNLWPNVQLLGPRDDVPRILRSCEIGVLSSRFEGLPVSLLEYGVAGLAAVTTAVGQCADVLGGGEAGILVPTGSPEQLARALVRLLGNEEERRSLAHALEARVRNIHNPPVVVNRIRGIYHQVLTNAPSEVQPCHIAVDRF